MPRLKPHTPFPRRAALAAALVLAGAPGALAAGIDVAVAEPAFALPEREPVRGLAAELREAAEKAMRGGCRPVVSAYGPLEGIDEKLRLRLARGEPAGNSALAPHGGVRDLVVLAIARADVGKGPRGRKRRRGYRVAMAAIDLKTGKPRQTARAVAGRARDLPGAVRAAALALKPALPCPRWRGEVILSARQTSAVDKPGVKRNGTIEWTIMVRLDGKTQRVAGRYALKIEARRCAGRAGKGPCVTRRTVGAGEVRAAPGTESRIDFGPDGRFRVLVGDGVATVALRTTTCAASDASSSSQCASRRIDSEVALEGGIAQGRLFGDRSTLVGAAMLVDTPRAKKTMSWSFEALLD